MKKAITILMLVLLTAISCKKAEEIPTPAEQLEIDIAKIQEFLVLNNLTAQSTLSGLHYIISEAGHADDYPDLDDEVQVHYKGFYIDSGGIFDQNLDDEDPSPFLLSNTIAGWREGMQLFNIGAKGMLLIPSGLAYGPYPPSGVKPNAVMVFEIELLDIIHHN